jgi:hypothetical protein
MLVFLDKKISKEKDNNKILELQDEITELIDKKISSIKNYEFSKNFMNFLNPNYYTDYQREYLKK